jgi:nucleoside-diphosphate-sugar epimerase
MSQLIKPNNKCVLLTGANGFLGKHIFDHLVTNGWQVNLLSSSGNLPLRDVAHNDLVRIFSYHDDQIEEATSNITAFLNFAVLYGAACTPTEDLNYVNLDLPIRILKAVIKNNSTPVNCIFGDTFYRKFPITDTLKRDYVNSKLSFEIALKKIVSETKKIRAAMLLIEQVYGPGEKLEKAYPRVVTQMLDKSISRVQLTSCEQQRDFIYVTDVAKAACLLAEKSWNGVIEVGCGSGISTDLQFVFRMLATFTETRAILGFGDLQPHQQFLVSKAKTDVLRKLGWQPMVSLDEGLKALVADVKTRLVQFL